MGTGAQFLEMICIALPHFLEMDYLFSSDAVHPALMTVGLRLRFAVLWSVPLHSEAILYPQAYGLVQNLKNSWTQPEKQRSSFPGF